MKASGPANPFPLRSPHNDRSDPDDNEKGGVIDFNFDTPAKKLHSLRFLDIETWGSYVDAWDAQGQQLARRHITPRGNGRATTIWVDYKNVRRIQIHLNTSAAVAALDFERCVVRAGEGAPRV